MDCGKVIDCLRSLLISQGEKLKMYEEVSNSKLNGSNSEAFTLIELLVVITIIGILTAILFPVIAQARQESKVVVCISNTRQIGNAMQMYSADFDERLPYLAYNTWQSTSQYNSFFCSHTGTCQPRWADMIMPYVKNSRIFTCPVDQSSLATHVANTVQLSYGLNIYAFNYDGGKLSSNTYGPGPALSEIPNPAARIFVTEASNRNDSVALWCFRSPKLNHDLDQDSCLLKHGKLPSVYFDGHAKLFRMHGLLDQLPYNAKYRGCSQYAFCVAQYYPEFAPWLP